MTKPTPIGTELAAIRELIVEVRGVRVLLDEDLARLYGVETRALNRAVSRNRARFPPDFLLLLAVEEVEGLRSQIGISKRGGRRHAVKAFTEQGVAMLSSVLRSPRAVAVNIEIMRAFVDLRRVAGAHHELSQRLDELERRYDGQFKAVFDAIRQLMTPPSRPGRNIGFKPEGGS